MIRITFKIELLLLAVLLAGCGGGSGDYAHRAEGRGGEAWQAVEAMLGAIRDAKSVQTAVAIHSPDGNSDALTYAAGQIRKATAATLVKLDRFGDTTRATVELQAATSRTTRTPKPPAVITLLLSADDTGTLRIVSAN